MAWINANFLTILLAPVVQTLDSAIHWINHYPLDNSIGFARVYPLDSDLSGGQGYPSFEQLGPGILLFSLLLCCNVFSLALKRLKGVEILTEFCCLPLNLMYMLSSRKAGMILVSFKLKDSFVQSF